jgi:DNA-directed RNA polymerase subunit H
MAQTDAVFNSYKTISEMFAARERQDITELLSRYSNTELDQILKTKNTFTLDFLGDAEVGKLRIIYYLENKVKIADIRALISEDVSKFELYMVVSKEKVSLTNNKAIHDMTKNVQVFEIRELQFNISSHILVPKHRLVNADSESLNAIFTKLNIKSRSQLPVILKTDPMAKFLNARTGDLVEILRNSPTSGEHVFYRMCV